MSNIGQSLKKRSNFHMAQHLNTGPIQEDLYLYEANILFHGLAHQEQVDTNAMLTSSFQILDQ